MICQVTPNELFNPESATTPFVAANPVAEPVEALSAAEPVPEPVEGVEALHESVPAPVDPAYSTPDSASETPLRQPLPINANKPNSAQSASSAIPPRHKPANGRQ